MKKKRKITIRLGPLGLSLVAAGITAVGFAAVSLADSGGSTTQQRKRLATFSAPAPSGGAGVTTFRGPNLSAADQKKMEEFRQCMQDNGAPAPPDPSNIDPSKGPPKPPSAADQEKIQKAYEACKDKLPAGMQNAGPPRSRHSADRLRAPHPSRGSSRTRTRATNRAPARAARAPEPKDSSRQVSSNTNGVIPRRPMHPPASGPPGGARLLSGAQPLIRLCRLCSPR